MLYEVNKKDDLDPDELTYMILLKRKCDKEIRGDYVDGYIQELGIDPVDSDSVTILMNQKM